MKKGTEEYEESLEAILTHYGVPAMLNELDAILENIKNGCMSVPLDNDPQTASLQIYKERMKYEGAKALVSSFVAKIEKAKTLKRSAR